MLVDYSDLEKTLENLPEPKILPKGTEIKARIIKVVEGVSEKNDAQWYQVIFDDPSDPTVVEFRDFFWDLSDSNKLDEKNAYRAAHKFKNFAQAFGIDYSRPFKWVGDLEGKEGWLIVGITKSDQYGEQNVVSKYIAKR